MRSLTFNLPIVGEIHLGFSVGSPLRTKAQLEEAKDAVLMSCWRKYEQLQEKLNDVSERFVALQKQAHAADRRRKRSDEIKAAAVNPPVAEVTPGVEQQEG